MMTNQEAIRILEFMKSEMLLNFDHDRKKALKLAISALEKQIPRKPSEGQVHIVYLCPNCGSLDFTFPYCRHCGQRLSWKEVYE